MTFTFAEWQSIAFDLRTAAEEYLNDARKVAAAGNTPLAVQFKRQADRSLTLAERIEAEHGV